MDTHHTLKAAPPTDARHPRSCNDADSTPGVLISPLSVPGRGGYAPIDHRAQRLREELPVQDPQRPVACLRRATAQTLSSTHVLHPPEVCTQTHTHMYIPPPPHNTTQQQSLIIAVMKPTSNLIYCNRSCVCVSVCGGQRETRALPTVKYLPPRQGCTYFELQQSHH